MRFDKLRTQLELILLLSEPQGYTVAQLCEKLELSRRNIYYLLDFLKQAGMILFKQRQCYHIDPRSPFFARLQTNIQFSDKEMLAIYNLLQMAGGTSETINQLRNKIDRAYNFSVYMNTPVRRHINNMVSELRRAIDTKHMVRLIDYSSPHSHTVSDRIVEPFLLMNNNDDVRCHELRSGTNKTFRINRIGQIEVLQTPWISEDKHRQVFTDIFMFAGETISQVKLLLGQLSHNLFLEEYPQGAKYLTPADETHWLLNIPICNPRGLGRFVLGLFNDIEILEGDSFRKYIASRLEEMNHRIKKE
ncbi:WYL domain-containing protein [Prevotella brunnea]|uniref:WYL domain-containing protein n=1 Tax=Prevotella brunnea TaxID=2508867 RepID=A0A5C8G7H7_9BACT|nr:WYL domain-containing protein [Prevotella brunnea]MDR0186422.1 WYL domain-containing protein [Prevotella brunnea]TXJ57923.1 WYL domain-containing protein [Prevotella brunnea]